MYKTSGVGGFEGSGGSKSGGLGDGIPPAGSRGRAPVGVWGQSPQKLTIKQENDIIFMLKFYAFLEGKAKHLTIL